MVSRKVAKSRVNTDNRGGFSAELNMTVTNRKDVKADVIVILSNGYADNLRISMVDGAAAPEKVSASEYRWKKTLNPDEVWQFGWKEDYFV